MSVMGVDYTQVLAMASTPPVLRVSWELGGNVDVERWYRCVYFIFLSLKSMNDYSCGKGTTDGVAKVLPKSRIAYRLWLREWYRFIIIIIKTTKNGDKI